jgi:hypothetical protein
MGIWPLSAATFLATCIYANGKPIKFGRPQIQDLSGRCAAVEFSYEYDAAGPTGPHDTTAPSAVFLFAKRPADPDFIQWGDSLEAQRVKSQDSWNTKPTFRVMMKGLPSRENFQVKIAALSTLSNVSGLPEASDASEMVQTRSNTSKPAIPQQLATHRTDPRSNLIIHDGSVCIDLHWSHPHTLLEGRPNDVYFRIKHNYTGEEPIVYCKERVTAMERSCGQHLNTVAGKMPARYATICGLRPKRRISFIIEAFTCDGESGISILHRITPPSAPSVVATIVTQPEDQQSPAGFRPRVVLDWIPQHDDLIIGHAIYLGLKQVSAMRLLCWVPLANSEWAKGHMELPILHKNHTFATDAMLVAAYLDNFRVHQEQQVLVTTRVHGGLESPAYRFPLGEWLLMDKDLKCLTSFDAELATYVRSEAALSWTQKQALSESA